MITGEFSISGLRPKGRSAYNLQLISALQPKGYSLQSSTAFLTEKLNYNFSNFTVFNYHFSKFSCNFENSSVNFWVSVFGKVWRVTYNSSLGEIFCYSTGLLGVASLLGSLGGEYLSNFWWKKVRRINGSAKATPSYTLVSGHPPACKI